MKMAICSRLTKSPGQNSVVEVHPSVTPRFLSQVTLTQNGLVSSTSVKPAQGAAHAGAATNPSNPSPAIAINLRIMVFPPRRLSVLDWVPRAVAAAGCATGCRMPCASV